MRKRLFFSTLDRVISREAHLVGYWVASAVILLGKLQRSVFENPFHRRSNNVVATTPDRS